MPHLRTVEELREEIAELARLSLWAALQELDDEEAAPEEHARPRPLETGSPAGSSPPLVQMLLLFAEAERRRQRQSLPWLLGERATDEVEEAVSPPAAVSPLPVPDWAEETRDSEERLMDALSELAEKKILDAATLIDRSADVAFLTLNALRDIAEGRSPLRRIQGKPGPADGPGFETHAWRAFETAEAVYSVNHGERPVGYQLIEWREHPNGAKFAIYERDGEAYVAFAGTEDLTDLLADMIYGTNQWQSIINSGYLQTYVDSHPGVRIHISGHSLGGALGQYFAQWLALERPGVQFDLTTFNALSGKYGAGVIFGDRAGTMLEGRPMQNLVWTCDVVSRAGEGFLGPAFHAGDISPWNTLEAHTMGSIRQDALSRGGIADGLDFRTAQPLPTATPYMPVFLREGASFQAASPALSGMPDGVTVLPPIRALLFACLLGADAPPDDAQRALTEALDAFLPAGAGKLVGTMTDWVAKAADGVRPLVYSPVGGSLVADWLAKWATSHLGGINSLLDRLGFTASAVQDSIVQKLGTKLGEFLADHPRLRRTAARGLANSILNVGHRLRQPARDLVELLSAVDVVKRAFTGPARWAGGRASFGDGRFYAVCKAALRQIARAGSAVQARLSTTAPSSGAAGPWDAIVGQIEAAVEALLAEQDAQSQSEADRLPERDRPPFSYHELLEILGVWNPHVVEFLVRGLQLWREEIELARTEAPSKPPSHPRGRVQKPLEHRNDHGDDLRRPLSVPPPPPPPPGGDSTDAALRPPPPGFAPVPLTSPVASRPVGGVATDVAVPAMTPLAALPSVLTLKRPVLLSLEALDRQARRIPAAERPYEIRFPGNLDRIHGVVVDHARNRTFLLGEQTRQGNGIDLSDFIVAVQAICIEQVSPVASLDPDPGNVAGPQWVHIEGAPRDSGFARTMLDADYEMKLLMVECGQVLAPSSFVSYLAEIRRRPRDRPSSHSRFWLSPQVPYVLTANLGEEVEFFLFDAHVRVQTQHMRDTGSVGGASGERDVAAEAAAESMAASYAALEHVTLPGGRQRVFHRLHRLFDVTTSVAVLAERAQGVGDVTSLAGLEIERLGPISRAPESYDGISVDAWTADSHFVTVSGGVDTWPHLRRPQLLQQPAAALSPLEVALERLLVGEHVYQAVSPLAIDLQGTAGPSEGPDPINEAQRFVAGRDGERARRVLLEAIQADGSYAEAIAYLAVVEWKLGDFTAARNALEEAVRLGGRRPFVARIARQFRERG